MLEVKADLEALTPREQAPAATPSPGTHTPSSLDSFQEHAVAVVFPVLALMIGAALRYLAEGCSDLCWIDFLLLAAPFSSGIWLGVSWSGRHVRHYLLYGMIVGTLAAPTILLIDAVAVDPGSYRDLLAESFRGLISETVLLVVSLPLISAMMFTSGGLFGDLIERSRHPVASLREAHPHTARLVEQVVPAHSQAFDRIVQLLTIVYPPTLLLLGTVFTALLAEF